jgi:PAS domain S-box-containing protein
VGGKTMGRAQLTDDVRAHVLVQTGLLGEAVDNAPVGIFVFDDHGRYIAVNSTACALLGYPREELLKQRVGSLAESPERALAEYEEVAKGEKAVGVTRARRKDGSIVELSFRGSRTTIAGMALYLGIAWPAER